MKNHELPSTIKLVKEVKTGRRESLEKLFSRYLPKVRRIVALRMGKKLQAFYDHEDLVQDALLKVFKGIDTFDESSHTLFHNWVAKCVENEIINQIRFQGAQKRGGEGEEAIKNEDLMLSSIIDPREKTPSWYVKARETESKVEEALLQLPEHYREVIILRFLCSCEYSEVAKLMNFGEEVNARMAVSRALKKLREKLGSDFDFN